MFRQTLYIFIDIRQNIFLAKGTEMSRQKRKTLYYKNYAEDFVISRKQNFILPPDYKWVNNNFGCRILSGILYVIMIIFAFVYLKFALHVTVENKSVLKKCKGQGFFLYGNHTQPVGDVLNPAVLMFPKHIYMIASRANLGIPVLGGMLPLLGALPVPDSMEGVKRICEAVDRRIHEKCCVVIYPEAHVWPWYTKIRPFPATSFRFPVQCDVPGFVMTTTYRKRKRRRKPDIKIYIDGPFYPDRRLSKKQQREKLCKEIYDCMEMRSKNSTYQYIHYEKERL